MTLTPTPANQNRDAHLRSFFCVGDRVEFEHGPETHRGTISAIGGTYHRIRTDAGITVAARATGLRPLRRKAAS